MNFRLEKDSMGAKKVPKAAYYGIQTFRAVENFPISGLRLQKEMVQAFALIKKAAAHTHAAVKRLPRRHSSAIIRACDEVLSGKFNSQFVVDVYQAGAGTSFNMNMNEVLANRANELLGVAKGTYKYVRPNDHVNMAQSTNDTFPTAIRLAGLLALPAMQQSMKQLESALRLKARAFDRIVKSGRTHLQDAVPVRLGREFSAYALALEKSRKAIETAASLLCELNLGGTAVGTGMNAYPQYRRKAIKALRTWTGFPLKPAQDMMERTQSMAEMGRLSAALRSYALEMIRIANDLRLMASGPNTGFGEIDLPAIQPGSSIMPGKVNPVVPEMIDMVGFQVLGHDTTVAFAVQAGQMELNVMMPVIAYNLLQAMHLLTSATSIFATKCVMGIKANPHRCEALAHRSLALVTALNPHIGYLNAAKVAKESLKSGKSPLELVIEHGMMSAKAAKKLLDPHALSKTVG